MSATKPVNPRDLLFTKKGVPRHALRYVNHHQTEDSLMKEIQDHLHDEPGFVILPLKGEQSLYSQLESIQTERAKRLEHQFPGWWFWPYEWGCDWTVVSVPIQQ